MRRVPVSRVPDFGSLTGLSAIRFHDLGETLTPTSISICSSSAPEAVEFVLLVSLLNSAPRPVTDFNEVSHQFIECIHNHLQSSKSKVKKSMCRIKHVLTERAIEEADARRCAEMKRMITLCDD